MNHQWLETLVMGVIFIAATSFAIKHFVPSFYVDPRKFFAGKNKRNIDIALVVETNAASCRTKCSACNGCSIGRS